MKTAAMYQRAMDMDIHGGEDAPIMEELFALFLSLTPEYQAVALRGVAAILQAEQGGAA